MRAELSPDEVVLVVNRSVPQGVELARFYAQQRAIPPDHIVQLDLPPTDDLGMEQFDSAVVAPVREYLIRQQLRDKARCLVTFYGTPLRLAPRHNSAAETAELKQIQQELSQTLNRLDTCITAMERKVVAEDSSFKPQTGGDLESLEQRYERVMQRINDLIPVLAAEPRQTLTSQATSAVETTGGPAALLRQPNVEQAMQATPDQLESPEVTTQRQIYRQMQAKVAAATKELPELLLRRGDAHSRQKLRDNSSQNFGLFELARTLYWQIDYLEPSEIAALDSELALLWHDQYPHKRLLPNPLAHGSRAPAEVPRTLMVMRLDAPQAGQVREMIVAGKLAERNGLQGRVVIDSQGLDAAHPDPAHPGFAPFDQKLKQLADLVRAETKLPLTFDDTPEVLGPGAAKGVAIYCGWYRLRHYVPSCSFVPGAIGFHVASFEMVSLHDPKESGWCRGLLNDGIAATLGAVDEPYLEAFPDPEAFFGILMTGRLTLAETYWLTTPAVSWKMVMIGDPLYRPFAAKPALQVQDLPPQIRDMLQAPATSPLQP